MTANIGNIDRIARFVLGALALILGLTSFGGTAQVIAIIVGLLLIGTAAMRFCAAYRLLGINTCKL